MSIDILNGLFDLFLSFRQIANEVFYLNQCLNVDYVIIFKNCAYILYFIFNLFAYGLHPFLDSGMDLLIQIVKFI